MYDPALLSKYFDVNNNELMSRPLSWDSLGSQMESEKVFKNLCCYQMSTKIFFPSSHVSNIVKNFELKWLFPNLSKYLWKSGLILKFTSFHQRFLLYCGEIMIFIQIFAKYWFANLKESCKMTLFSLKFLYYHHLSWEKKSNLCIFH